MQTNRRFGAFVGAAVFMAVTLSSGISHAEYKKNYVGEMGVYRAVYEDTLVHLARKYNLGFVELRAANPDLDTWIPGANAKVILPTQHLLPDAPRKDIVINLPEMRIFAFINGDEAPSTYPIGIGREGLETPIGKTTIVRKTEDPVWRPTPRMRKEKPELPEVVYPGPENPMGTHAMYLGWAQYAIHGTNKPYGIGRRSSSGCIRMYPEGIIDLYQHLPVGTIINVVNQPIKVQWIDNELYLEAHPDMEQALKMEETGVIEHQKLKEEDMQRIIQKAGKYQDLLNWPRIRTIVRERKGFPVMIARIVGDKTPEQTIHQTKATPAKNNKIAYSVASKDEKLVTHVTATKVAEKPTSKTVEN